MKLPGLLSRVGAILLISFATSVPVTAQETTPPKVAIVIHGGAGTILKERMTPEREAAYRDAITEALRTGHRMLLEGGSGLDAVVASIKLLEESPLFNAGRGAVFTNKGTVELDASIMDGRDRRAGAVAAVSHVRSPITLARLIMDKSPHVLMVGDGAEEFARENGLELVENEYFHTDRRKQQLERARQRDRAGRLGYDASFESSDEKFGTVGVLALDQDGNLAAGTSTGGTTNKRFGRIGDSPIVGAGTFADNRSCAVSATGHGEYFIRGVIAYSVCAKMQYQGLDLTEAANSVVHEDLTEMGGTGGVIALDRQGNIAMPFNTAGMYRGYIDTTGNLVFKIYRD